MRHACMVFEHYIRREEEEDTWTVWDLTILQVFLRKHYCTTHSPCNVSKEAQTREIIVETFGDFFRVSSPPSWVAGMTF